MAMSTARFTVFDGDGHVLENDQELARYYEGEYKGMRFFQPWSIFPSLDGWARGVVMAKEDPDRQYTHTDARIWGEILEMINAEGSVLYPTAGLALGLITDHRWAVATANAYNNWLEDLYCRKDKRLWGVGLLAVQEPVEAAKELMRCKRERQNFVAMMLPSVTHTGKTYGDRSFWPIYEAAQRHDMPLALHGGPSRGFGFDHLRDMTRVHTLEHPVPLMIQLTDMIFSGMFDEFPNLRVAYLEGGCGWVPFMMDRLDYEYNSVFGGAARKRLRKKPSDYIRGENFYVAMELGETALSLKYALDAIGSEKILYASDYPHEPTNEAIKNELAEFIASNAYSAQVKQNLLYANIKRFYGMH
jgi:uncharacterized protein